MALTEEKKAQAKKWRDANKEHRAAYQRAWNDKHPEYATEYLKQYHKTRALRPPKDLERIRRLSAEGHLRRNFNLTIEQINEMSALQDHKCGICAIPFDPSSKKTKPHVDHDHASKKIRGLLCHKCNVGLGQFNDSVEILNSAVAYLADT